MRVFTTQLHGKGRIVPLLAISLFILVGNSFDDLAQNGAQPTEGSSENWGYSLTRDQCVDGFVKMDLVADEEFVGDEDPRRISSLSILSRKAPRHV